VLCAPAAPHVICSTQGAFSFMDFFHAHIPSEPSTQVNHQRSASSMSDSMIRALQFCLSVLFDCLCVMLWRPQFIKTRREEAVWAGRAIPGSSGVGGTLKGDH